MSSTESNPPRREQEEQAQNSPLKTPQTETAHVGHAEAADAAGNQQHRTPESSQGEVSSDPPYARETAGGTGAEDQAQGGPRVKHLHDARPRGADLANDHSLDNTVDTDGKNRDALKPDQGGDQQVTSNATPENHVITPSFGLAGIDSRPGGNRPAVLTRPGSTVVYVGDDEIIERYGASADETDPAAEHYPPNQALVGHRIRIVAKGDGQ